jgi:hypothetical protein
MKSFAPVSYQLGVALVCCVCSVEPQTTHFTFSGFLLARLKPAFLNEMSLPFGLVVNYL